MYSLIELVRKPIVIKRPLWESIYDLSVRRTQDLYGTDGYLCITIFHQNYDTGLQPPKKLD